MANIKMTKMNNKTNTKMAETGDKGMRKDTLCPNKMAMLKLSEKY